VKVLIATSTVDFDPTEVAIPWKTLSEAGHEVHFATDTGAQGRADARMLDGNGLGIWKPLLRADARARAAYAEMLGDARFGAPLRYEEITVDGCYALLLPGGHAKGIKPYLESGVLQRAIAGFFATGKPVGAICHGVVAAARSTDPASGRSVLFGRKTTALLERQERTGYLLTKRRLGDYYLTYPVTVEAEVTAALAAPEDFRHGPLPVLRDTPEHLSRGFTMRDRNYLSARWPGDVHRFSRDFLDMLG